MRSIILSKQSSRRYQLLCSFLIGGVSIRCPSACSAWSIHTRIVCPTKRRDYFGLPPPWSPRSRQSIVFSHHGHHHQAKSICTFEEEDFQGGSSSWPYQAKDFFRLDNSDDGAFYQEPRLVTHIDDRAISLLTDYYRNEFESLILNKNKKSSSSNNNNNQGTTLDVLDLCSSWISHLPKDIRYGKVVGLGMNKEELVQNEQLTDHVVQDLNKNPLMPQFDNDSFDVICNVVSVDYLTKPKEVFQEMHRILRPGGVALMSFSNRCFPTKAVAMWLQADDIDRLSIVASYFHYSAKWASLEALDLKEKQQTPDRPSAQDMMRNPSLGLAWMTAASAVAKNNQGDPLFVVKGVK